MKRCLLSVFILILIVGTIPAQKSTRVTAVSPKVYISIGKEQPKPPYLEIRDLNFKDADGNNIIDARESTMIYFDLHNTGTGPGVSLELVVTEKNNVQGLQFENKKRLVDLKENTQQHCIINITGTPELKNDTALFQIEVREGNGFHADPVEIEVVTSVFKAPLVKVVDTQISSQNSGKLEKRKTFDLDLLMQNLGHGVASNVTIQMQKPANVYCLSANERENVGTLKAGEKRLISYTMVTNNEFNSPSIELIFTISERYGQFAENKTVNLVMNQKVSTEKLVVEAATDKTGVIVTGSLGSDIDKNIPETDLKNPVKVALIIGNENYSGLNAEVNVEFARQDAEIFRNYAIQTLGLEEKNVFLITDATSGLMSREIDRVAELVKRLGSEAELIFFYAGHGYPDEGNQAPYLIPVDVNASNLVSAIPLQKVYQKFSETNAKKITVLLDACFSGGGRNQGILVGRAVRIKPKNEAVSGNMVVFAASSGDQTALPFTEQKHGMFSYFLMKKLQETKGQVTFGELFNYLKTNVGVESLRVNGKSQDPNVIFSPVLMETWQSLTF